MRYLVHKALKMGFVLLLFPAVFTIIVVVWVFYIDPPRGLGDY